MNWKDINIRKGKELYFLDKDDFYNENPIEKLTQQLCIILDKDVEWVESLPLTDVFKYQEDLSFLKEMPTGDFDKSITINDIEYKMVELTTLNFGQWVDLDTYCKDVFGNLENIMALLYRPDGDVYNIKSAQERAKLFLEKMSYETAAGAALFFSLLEMASINHMKDSSLLDQMILDLTERKNQLKKELQSMPQKKKHRKKRKSNSNGS